MREKMDKEEGEKKEGKGVRQEEESREEEMMVTMAC